MKTGRSVMEGPQGFLDAHKGPEIISLLHMLKLLVEEPNDKGTHFYLNGTYVPCRSLHTIMTN